MDGGAAEWVITDEFAQRLGCGVLTAAVLPVWFLLLLFAVDSVLALFVTGAIFLLTAGFAAAATRRARRLPRLVRIESGVLTTEARSGSRSRALADLSSVEIGTSLGVWPVRLTFADGTDLRLPRELDDLDGFLDALRDHRPDLVVVDRNPAGAGDDDPGGARHRRRDAP